MRNLSLGGRAVHPPLLLAPMLDISGRAFRNLIREQGGCGLFYSEMLNAQRVLSEKINSPILAGLADEGDVMIQLVGNAPEILSRAVRHLEAMVQPAGFDLNLGCSMAAVCRRGWGADLLRNPTQAAAALRGVRQATTRPVTVKIRQVWENETQAKSLVRALEMEGADAVIVHPRPAEGKYKRPCHWEWVGKIKSWLGIPVIGNGDIFSAGEAVRRFQETGCDGLMIGRGAVARPTLFREIEALDSGRPLPRPLPPVEVLNRMISNVGADLHQPGMLGAKRSKEFKTFCQYFSLGLPVPHWFWAPLQSLRDGRSLAEKALKYFEKVRD